jgi:hypothetical protein
MDMHVPAPGTLLTLERGDVRIWVGVRTELGAARVRAIH